MYKHYAINNAIISLFDNIDPAYMKRINIHVHIYDAILLFDKHSYALLYDAILLFDNMKMWFIKITMFCTLNLYLYSLQDLIYFIDMMITFAYTFELIDLDI